jgi:hypothetical protein
MRTIAWGLIRRYALTTSVNGAKRAGGASKSRLWIIFRID